MNKEKSVLEYIKNVPEWHSALIREQLSVLNRTASILSDTASRIDRGFANSVLHPEKYQFSDPGIRKALRSGPLDQTTSALGNAWAALEVLTVLSDAYQTDRGHSIEFAHDCYYNELEKLCIRHGYKGKDDE